MGRRCKWTSGRRCALKRAVKCEILVGIDKEGEVVGVAQGNGSVLAMILTKATYARRHDGSLGIKRSARHGGRFDGVIGWLWRRILKCLRSGKGLFRRRGLML